MKSRHVLLVAAAAGLLFSQGYGAFAQVPFPAPPALKPFPFVSPLFGDDMVLQRGKMDTIWGWSEPGRPCTRPNRRQDRIRRCRCRPPLGSEDSNRLQPVVPTPSRSPAVKPWNFTT